MIADGPIVRAKHLPRLFQEIVDLDARLEEVKGLVVGPDSLFATTPSTTGNWIYFANTWRRLRQRRDELSKAAERALTKPKSGALG